MKVSYLHLVVVCTRLKNAYATIGYEIKDHFADIDKMVEIGSVVECTIHDIISFTPTRLFPLVLG